MVLQVCMFLGACLCSEYGERWHEMGTMDKKQNVFDDFQAAAEFLIENKYTTPQRWTDGDWESEDMYRVYMVVDAVHVCYVRHCDYTAGLSLVYSEQLIRDLNNQFYLLFS